MGFKPNKYKFIDIQLPAHENEWLIGSLTVVIRRGQKPQYRVEGMGEDKAASAEKAKVYLLAKQARKYLKSRVPMMRLKPTGRDRKPKASVLKIHFHHPQTGKLSMKDSAARTNMAPLVLHSDRTLPA